MRTREKGILGSSDIYFLTPSKQAINTFFYVTCVGHFSYEDSYHLERETYNSYLLMYIAKGKAVIETEGKSYLASKGEVVYMNCYKAHGYRALEQLETIWFHFDGLGAAAYYEALAESDSPVFSLSDDSRAVHYIRRIYENYQQRKGSNPVTEAVVGSYVTAVLAELFQTQLGFAGKTERYGTLVEETGRYVKEHLADRLDISALAVNVSLSTFHFARIFKKESGYTPHEFVVKSRINHAKAMLKGTDLSQREIAWQCGFLDESCFINAFKRNVGMTPGAFRRMKI